MDVLTARRSVAGLGRSGAPGRKSVFVTATGTVTAIDRRSRVGLARMRVAVGPAGEVAIQIGPVIRGTALRDATSFIRFNDFANQFEFAAVSNALHERVLRDVVGRLDLDALTGTPVTVIGATTLQAGTPADAVLDIVPIQLQIAGGAR
jgi:predicted lipoprotein